MITHERLLQMLDYDPASGVFTRRVGTKDGKKGSVSGSVRKQDGYVMISLDRHLCLGHILAWFYVHGVWPEFEIDHKDRNRANNAISNLRPSNRSLNGFNQNLKKNKSGFKGVTAVKGKFVAAIRVNYQKTVLGTFSDPIDAAKAYDTAASKMVGPTATTNKSLGLIT